MTRRATDEAREVAASPDHRDLLLAAALFAVLAVVYVATASTGPAQVNDTRAASVAAWTLATQGTATLPDTWPASRNYWGVQGPGGRVHVNRFPGVAYWAAPAYLVADVVGDDEPPAHPLLIDPTPAAVAAALTAAAAAAVLLMLLRRTVSRPVALAGAGVFALGTSLWSVAADALWPHGPALLVLATLLLGWRSAHPVVAALAAGVAVLVRPHLVVAVVVLAAYALLRERRRDGGWLLGGAAVGLAALTAYSAWAFGVALPVAGYDVGDHLGGLVSHTPARTAQDLVLAFASPTHGLLVYSPVVVAGVVGAVLARRRLPAWTLAAALAGAVYLLVQVRALGYRGGEDFYAYRIGLEPLLLAAPLLVLGTLELVRRWRWALLGVGLLAAASVALHAYGAVAGGLSEHLRGQWEEIDAAVTEEFGDQRLGEVDLRN